MGKHTFACDDFMAVLVIILTDCKGQFITQQTLRRLLDMAPPCPYCVEQLLAMQSTLTGRIYLQQLRPLVDMLQEDSFNNVLDMFGD